MKPSVKWVFAASLAINIFLVGLILGRSVPPPFPPMHGIPPYNDSLGQLPPEKREAVEQMMERMQEHREKDFGKVEPTRQEMVAILEAAVFDEDRFIAKSKELDAFFSSSAQRMTEEIAALARGFSPQERHALAELLRRPPPPPMVPPPGTMH